MPRSLAVAVLLLIAGTLAGLAYASSAGTPRYIVEDGASGTYSNATAPTLVYGQSATTLRAAVCEADVCTRAPPVNGYQEGLRIGGIDAVRVTVCALPGSVLTGTGRIEVYYYDDVEASRTGNDAGYSLNASSGHDIEVTGECEILPDFIPGATLNGTRAVFVANGVGVSGSGALPDGGSVVVVKTLGICQGGTC